MFTSRLGGLASTGICPLRRGETCLWLDTQAFPPKIPKSKGFHVLCHALRFGVVGPSLEMSPSVRGPYRPYRLGRVEGQNPFRPENLRARGLGRSLQHVSLSRYSRYSSRLRPEVQITSVPECTSTSRLRFVHCAVVADSARGA